MVMSWIFLGALAMSVAAALILGTGGPLSAAVAQGAQAGITLAVSLAGSICLWTGVGKVMEKAGITAQLAKCLGPVLGRLFPTYKKDPAFAGTLCANVCANILGLGNAATPMGIRAAQHLAKRNATDELCRLIVLNTASIQLIPATVAALRASLGCAAPFDILPAVWVTSICAASMGLLAAWVLGKVWKK